MSWKGGISTVMIVMQRALFTNLSFMSCCRGWRRTGRARQRQERRWANPAVHNSTYDFGPACQQASLHSLDSLEMRACTICRQRLILDDVPALVQNILADRAVYRIRVPRRLQWPQRICGRCCQTWRGVMSNTSTHMPTLSSACARGRMSVLGFRVFHTT